MKQKGSVNVFTRLLLAGILVFSLACTFPVYASVEDGDVILGKTVKERGLNEENCPDLSCKYACLTDKNGVILFQRNDTEEAKIASMTKIMTALVALDNREGNDEIYVSKEAATVGESSANLKEGEVLSFDDALKALMVPSGNDAGIALAQTIGAHMINADVHQEKAQTCINAFVEAMNKKAEAIGMKQSVFTNPHGLDSDEFEGDLHSTAYDVSLMTAYAMKNDDFRALTDEKTAVIYPKKDGVKRSIVLYSTDLLLGSYKGMCGVKTGFTDAAGPCFAGANKRDDSEIYSVVMHAESEDSRFEDTKALFDWYYKHNVDYNLIQTETYLNEAEDTPIVAYVSHKDWMSSTIPATIKNPQETIKVFDLEGNIEQEAEFDDIHGNVHTGDKLGSIKFEQNGRILADIDIIAAQDVEAPSLLDSIGIFFNRIICKFSGAPQYAESVLVNTAPPFFDEAR